MLGLQQTIRPHLVGVELDVSRCTHGQAYVTFWVDPPVTEEDREDIRWILAEMDVDEFLEWTPTVRAGAPEFSTGALALYARDGGAPSADVSWMDLTGKGFRGSLQDQVAAYLAVAAEPHSGIVNVWSVGNDSDVCLLVDVAESGTLLGEFDPETWSCAVRSRFQSLSKGGLRFEYRGGELGRWNPPSDSAVGVFTRALS